MMYEVEQKFRVDDWSKTLKKVREMNAKIRDPISQTDQYYAHPSRDFGETDEALRIRRVGDKNWITFKGPRVDNTTKTREELELILPDGSADQFGKLFSLLGFLPVAVVRKERFHADLTWQDRNCKVAFDDVEGIGKYIEVETMAEPEDYEAAKACLDSLAATLGLADGERRSYLELVWERISA
jgi:adenylate cyclase class 2